MGDIIHSNELWTNEIEESDYISRLKDFLNWLIDKSESDKKQKEGLVQNTIPLFVFVSKKGYWIYRLVEYILRQGTDSSRWEEALHNHTIEVKSDRYFTKMISLQEMPKELENRQVYVIDDFLVTKRNIFRFYNLIKKKVPPDCFTPIVFARGKGSQEKIQGEVFDTLSFQDNVASEEIGRFSIWETKSFHQYGIPYVIDLPFLTFKNTNKPERFFSGKLTSAQFEALKNNRTSLWQCMDASYRIGNYSAESCFFYCQHDLFLDKFRYLIQNLVVKCDYNNEENGMVNLTFTPFAILRSIRRDELIFRFRIAFSGTEYGRELEDYLRDPTTTDADENLYTALYRSMVFFFSRYISINFKNYLYNQSGVELGLNEKELTHHWSQKFIKSLSTIFENEKQLKERLNRLYEKNDITPYTPGFRSGLRRRSDSMYYNAFTFFAFEKMSNESPSEFCSFEELENAMAVYNGCAVDDADFRKNFTCTILQLLNQGVISNQVSFDRNTGVVQRGFRSGENSAVLLPFDQRSVFKAIYTYYCQICEDRKQLTEKVQSVRDIYFKNYSAFRVFLIKFIKDSELDSYLNLKEAEDTLSYFGEEVDEETLKKQMENKKYIIEDLEDSARKNATDAWVAKLLEQYVQRMSFQ